MSDADCFAPLWPALRFGQWRGGGAAARSVHIWIRHCDHYVFMYNLWKLCLRQLHNKHILEGSRHKFCLCTLLHVYCDRAVGTCISNLLLSHVDFCSLFWLSTDHRSTKSRLYCLSNRTVIYIISKLAGNRPIADWGYLLRYSRYQISEV